MGRKNWCRWAILLLSFQFPLSFLKAGTTSWTGSAGNGLWSDEGNWSSGVPTADSDASLSIPGHINVSLGGATRKALTITEGGGLESSLILSDGTLDTTGIWAGGFTTIQSGLTNTLSQELNLAGWIDVQGPISGSGYALNISPQIGSDVSLRGDNTYQGDTMVGGSLSLYGTILASPNIQIAAGGYLGVGNPRAFGSDNQRLELSGGTLAVEIGSPTTARLPRLKLSGGTSKLDNTTSILTAPALVRGVGSTLSLYVTDSGGLELDTPPVLHGDGHTSTRLPIAPWATALLISYPLNEQVFATYDAATGFRPLHLDEFSALPAAGENVRLADTSFAQQHDLSVNSLIVSASTLTLQDSRFSVASGGLILDAGTSSATPARILGNGSLLLPPEGIIYAYRSFSTTTPHLIDVPIIGGTLVKAGDGVLALTKPNSFTGGTILTSGTLLVRDSGALGEGPIDLRGGLLSFDVPTHVVNNELKIEASSTITIRPGTTLTLSGQLSGEAIATFDRIYQYPLVNDVVFHFTGSGSSTGKYGFMIGSAGTLLIDGDMPSPDSFAGNGGGGPITIGGHGNIGGRFESVGATVSPGGAADGSTGRLTAGEAIFYGSDMRFDLNDLIPGDGYDQLVVTRSLLLSPNPINDNDLDVLFGFSLAPGMKFKIIDNQFSGAVDGFFKGLPEGTVFTRDGQNLEISYVAGDGNDVVLTVVPEPGSGLLAASTLMLLLRRQRV